MYDCELTRILIFFSQKHTIFSLRSSTLPVKYLVIKDTDAENPGKEVY